MKKLSLQTVSELIDKRINLELAQLNKDGIYFDHYKELDIFDDNKECILSFILSSFDVYDNDNITITVNEINNTVFDMFDYNYL